MDVYEIYEEIFSMFYSSLHVNTKGVIFYAVPHRGSDIASMVAGKARYFLLPSFEVQALQKGTSLQLEVIVLNACPPVMRPFSLTRLFL